LDKSLLIADDIDFRHQRKRFLPVEVRKVPASFRRLPWGGERDTDAPTTQHDIPNPDRTLRFEGLVYYILVDVNRDDVTSSRASTTASTICHGSSTVTK
jgi:hypothetical protein